jgi:hypothetical protein
LDSTIFVNGLPGFGFDPFVPVVNRYDPSTTAKSLQENIVREVGIATALPQMVAVQIEQFTVLPKPHRSRR